MFQIVSKQVLSRFNEYEKADWDKSHIAKQYTYIYSLLVTIEVR